MTLTGVRIVHAIPGRIRLKIRQIQDHPQLAWEVEEQLSRIPGVSDVEANPVTGSVLVLFEDRQPTPADSLRFLSSSWPTEALGPLEMSTSENGHTNGSNGDRLAAMDRRIVDLFRSFNSGVGEATSGIDLKLLVPLTLFFLGVRGLFTEKMPFPAWYDFFWFALSTFVMLNRSAIEGPATPPSPALP